MTMKVYEQDGYVLGHRCSKGHAGNRRYALNGHGHGQWAECQGCLDFRDAHALAFSSREAAAVAEREVNP